MFPFLLRYRWLLAFSVVLGIGVFAGAEPLHAVPGERVDEVIAWIQAHPTLQPGRGERLLVRRSDTPARRFTFQASINPPGRVTAVANDIIRSEQLTLLDLVNGISRDRLENSLRVIYDRELYQDYEQSVVVMVYPPSNAVESGQPTPNPALRQGEIRQGDRFAYWIETTQNADGLVYSAQITVFLKEDIEKLQTEMAESNNP